MTNADFERLEKSMGMSWCPEGVLADPDLRCHVAPASVNTYDSMHCVFSNGSIHVELWLLKGRLKLIGVGADLIEGFLSSAWKWPRDKAAKGKALAEVFCPARLSQDHLRAGATEMIMLYPLIRFLLTTVVMPSGQLGDEVSSFLSLCDVLDTLQDLKRGRSSPEALARCVATHLEAFQKAYGLDLVKPKQHFTAHIPAQVSRDGGLLLDCFTLERKH